MNKASTLLGAALLVSVLANAVMYRRIQEPASPARPMPAGHARALEARSPAAPAPTSDPALVEINPEPAPAALPAPEAARAEPPPAAPSALKDLPDWMAKDPEISAALEQREHERAAVQKYWRDLGRLLDVRQAIGLPRFREAVARLTADYLGFDANTGAAFASAAVRVGQEAERIEAERRDAIAKARAAAPDKETRKRLEDEIDTRADQQRKAALANLDPFWTPAARHQEFRQKPLWKWLEYMDGP
jgi:hypothetical protein